MPQLGWAVWGGCRREMLAEGLPTVNTTSSIQQGEPSQRCPRASLCSPPLPLTLLKRRRRFGCFMQQRDRKENITVCL